MRNQLLSILCVALLTAGLAGCGGGGSTAPVLSVSTSGAATLDIATLNAFVATYPLATLSPTEAASLAMLREEEQLAHDVYAVSATLWPQPIFPNITDSEATHAAAIKVLLDRYEQPDPLAGLPNGTFKSPEFQALYDSLVARSRQSAIEALTVGVEIEELDIRDITAQMAGIDNADILMVYDNLLSASRSHLAAFVKVLAQQDVTYVPKYISKAQFDAIVRP